VAKIVGTETTSLTVNPTFPITAAYLRKIPKEVHL
jgi:hypothetical protein